MPRNSVQKARQRKAFIKHRAAEARATKIGGAILGLVLVGLIVLAACGTSPTEKSRDLADELVYFKDHRVGMCFAFWKHPESDAMDSAILAHVPCDEKVERLIVNGAEIGR